MEFASIKEARDFIKRYEDVSNFEMFGITNWEYLYINDKWPNDIQFNYDLIRILTIDIEVESEGGFPNVDEAKERVNALTLRMNDTVIVLGLENRYTPAPDVTYVQCKTEEELLEKFVKFWLACDPDIVTGWYCRWFDIPYMYNRIKRLLGEATANKLSPFHKVIQKQTTIGNQLQNEYDVVGIALLDYMDVYKKFSGKNQESYRLDHIAHEELKENKLDYSEYITLKNLYKQDWQKYIDYNIHDTTLVVKLEAKLKLLEMIVYIAYLCKVNYNDVFKQTRMWDALIHAHLAQKNIVVPFRKTDIKATKYMGAFVKPPKSGMHQWVVGFDLNSLYPHLIMQYNIGPDTLVENMHRDLTISDVIHGKVRNESNYSMAGNGYFFRKDEQSFLAELMQKLYDGRVIAKNKMLEAEKKYQETKNQKYENEKAAYKNKQTAYKVTLNSAYGSIGNEYFRFFDVRLAEAVTISGQLTITWIFKKLNDYMNAALKTHDIDYIIAGDTDSMYLDCSGLVARAKADKLAYLENIFDKFIEPYIEKSFAELANIMGAYAQRMVMKREVIADRGIWTTKKRYMLNMLVNEGIYYKWPKLKFVGIEAIRSDTPEFARERLKRAIRIIMAKDEASLQQYVALVRNRFDRLTFEQIATPTSISQLDKFANAQTIYGLGTPIHARAALLYNSMIERLNLIGKYPLIRGGEKMKFCYLKTPNPIHENVIGAIDALPEEFELDSYLDRELQFTKTFLDPIEAILETIKWEAKKTSTLDQFFT